mmetsp:Transcript_62238/g.140754  ORF Transcript_62238/g.140754 Transcript_62238/m.140754 type:complete len:344 (+) Transcript_62238:690-1721(+)
MLPVRICAQSLYMLLKLPPLGPGKDVPGAFSDADDHVVRTRVDCGSDHVFALEFYRNDNLSPTGLDCTRRMNITDRQGIVRAYCVCGYNVTDIGRGACRPFATGPSSFAPPSFIRVGAEVEFANSSRDRPRACPKPALAYSRGDKAEIKSLVGDCFTTTADPERWAPVGDLVRGPTPGNRSIWVLNTGAHTHNLRSYDSTIKNVLELMLKRIFSTRDIAVFRTTPPGHPGCEKYEKPFETEAEALHTSQPGIEGYDWDMHAKYDTFLRKRLASLEGGAPNEKREQHGHSRLRHFGGVVLLDVTLMTLLRGDGHRAPLHDRDCLHHFNPGVGDYWNHLLFSTLL